MSFHLTNERHQKYNWVPTTLAQDVHLDSEPRKKRLYVLVPPSNNTPRSCKLVLQLGFQN